MHIGDVMWLAGAERMNGDGRYVFNDADVGLCGFRPVDAGDSVDGRREKSVLPAAGLPVRTARTWHHPGHLTAGLPHGGPGEHLALRGRSWSQS